MGQITGKFLIIAGVFAIVSGIIFIYSGKSDILRHFGKLPGDIYIKKENFSFYIPVTTSIILSILLSIIIRICSKDN